MIVWCYNGSVKLPVDVSLSKLQAKSFYISPYPSRFLIMNQYVFKNMLNSKHCIIQHDKLFIKTCPLKREI